MLEKDTTIDLDLIKRTHARIADKVAKTPLYRSVTMSNLLDRDIYFKLENLQFTSSFKERGVVAKLGSLTAAERANGVIAMSAGNHAQALAYHAAQFDVNATIVMPRTTPITKIDKTRHFKPEILVKGDSFDETIAETRKVRDARNLTLIHPFDDPIVIAGQGTIGVEICDQLERVDTIVVPVGGGGLISGIATAAKALQPQVRIIGAQAALYQPAYAQYKDHQWQSSPNQLSIAEGIAVKHPGALTMPIIKELVDDMVTVSEAAIETAMFRYFDIEKIVVEGAGATALAAVTEHPEIARGKHRMHRERRKFRTYRLCRHHSAHAGSDKACRAFTLNRTGCSWYVSQTCL